MQTLCKSISFVCLALGASAIPACTTETHLTLFVSCICAQLSSARRGSMVSYKNPLSESLAKFLAFLSFQSVPTVKFCNSFLLLTIRIARSGGRGSPFSIFTFPFSVWLSLFSYTYALPNLQLLCFENVATVGWVGGQ